MTWVVQLRPHSGMPWRQPKEFSNRELARDYLRRKLAEARPENEGQLVRSYRG